MASLLSSSRQLINIVRQQSKSAHARPSLLLKPLIPSQPLVHGLQAAHTEASIEGASRGSSVHLAEASTSASSNSAQVGLLLVGLPRQSSERSGALPLKPGILGLNAQAFGL